VGLYLFFLVEEDAIKVENSIFPNSDIYVAFDQLCGVCKSFVWVSRHLLLVSPCVHFIPIESAHLPSQLGSLNIETLLVSMHGCIGDRVYSGFSLIGQIFKRSPFGIFCLPVIFILEKTNLGNKLYAWISRNRYRIGCSSQVCHYKED
jgi:predicted DCC family thiol-disulfide oxidoreductase YuxK